MHANTKILAVSTRRTIQPTAVVPDVACRDTVKFKPKVTFALDSNVATPQELTDVSGTVQANIVCTAPPIALPHEAANGTSDPQVSLASTHSGAGLPKQVTSDLPHLSNIPRHKQSRNRTAMFRRKDRNRKSERSRNIPQATVQENINPTDLNLNTPIISDLNLNLEATVTPVDQENTSQENRTPASNAADINRISSPPASLQPHKSGTPIAYSIPPDTMQEIKKQSGLKFTIDLNGLSVHNFEAAENIKHCTNIQQALTTELKGETPFIYTNRTNAKILVESYNLAKLTNKELKAACLIPASDISKLRSELSSWILIHTFKRRQYKITKHYSDSSPLTTEGGMDLHLFTDHIPEYLQTTYGSNPEKYKFRRPELSMTFKGQISGQSALIGTDSFAEGCGYITPEFVAEHRLHTRPCLEEVMLGDGSTKIQSTEECIVHLQLGTYACKVWLLVVPLPAPYQVLLGDTWLEEHGARLLYDKKCIEIRTKKRRFTIPTIHAEKQTSYTPTKPSKKDPRVLSAMQLRRAYHQGLPMVLCHIQKEGSIQEPENQNVDPDVQASHQEKLKEILNNFPDVFGDTLHQDAPVRPDMPEVIPLIPGSKIPNRPLYRYSPIEQAEIERQVEAMLEQGLVEPSISPFGAPVLLVKKPDGSWRFCVDYRALNQITVKNGHALPRIDDLLDKIQGAQYFSTMDLLQGFYQLPLRESDRPKTAFKTTFGHYQFRVVSMGLSNSPSVFQRVMNQIFKKQLNKSVLIYLDDILVFSKTPEEHLQHIKEVLETVKANHLSLKTKKCHFFRQELKFLGHIISKDGIKPDPEKVQAVVNWDEPTNQTQVRGFLGMTTYFKRYIKGYAKIAAPLMELTKDVYKHNFRMTEAARKAFQKLKDLLVNAPLLKVPDFEKPFTLITDASNVGLGGVLLQGNQPCAFESKKFTAAECAYTTTEREMLATVYCFQKWSVYLRHNPLNEIQTDHMPNVYINTKPQLSAREIRWMETLATFPGQWKYKPGKSNIADPLSRMPSFYIMAILKTNRPLIAPPLQNEQTALLDRIRQSYKDDASFPSHLYTLADGLYYQNNRIVIPNVPDLKQHILHECHDSLFAGHLGRDKTVHAVQTLFTWRGLTKDVKDYIQQCHVCQTTKPSNAPPQGLLLPPETAEVPWRNISVDLITGLPLTTSGHDSILTVVDRCTKMVHLAKTDVNLTAEGFAQLMQDHVFSKHGLPLDIIHDRDPRFTGHFFTEVCKHLGIHQSMTSAWHPQSDGQTERMNRTIEQVLRAHAADKSLEWDKTLSMVEFAMNNSLHASLNQTPFFLNTGIHPITPIMLDVLKGGKFKSTSAFDFSSDRKQAFDFAMQQLKAARDRYKSYADANRQDKSFEVGDKVLLSTVNLNKHNQRRKLYPKFVGPFQITSKVNDVAYKLDLPANMPIHNVFHVSLLKQYFPGRSPPPPMPLLVEGELEYEIERILMHRDIKLKKATKREFFIKWLGYGPEHCTWEPESHLQNAQEAIKDYWDLQKQLQIAQHNKLNKQTVKATKRPKLTL
jgi:hypothetical protein